MDDVTLCSQVIANSPKVFDNRINFFYFRFLLFV